jgi:hypothetical protein
VKSKKNFYNSHMTVTQEMKDWFGNGEADVDLMLRLGILKEETIVLLWENDPSSPGFRKPEP